MSMNLSHLARPYAKAAFAYAEESKAIPIWQAFLTTASYVMKQENVKKWVANPEISRDSVHQAMVELLDLQGQAELSEFLRVLVDYRRLEVLPFIAKQFAKLLADYEKRIDVRAITALPLTTDQEKKLIAALEKRWQRTVNLHSEVDASILGGVILRTDDWVIDGSGRGRLAQLNEYLKGKMLCN